VTTLSVPPAGRAETAGPAATHTPRPLPASPLVAAVSATGLPPTWTTLGAGSMPPGRILVSVADSRLAAHTEPPATASASGPSPTGITTTTASVLGLTRVTVLSRLLATHTEPRPNVTAVGSVPTGICWLTRPPRGSTRVSLSSAGLVTHTEPAPNATPNGAEGNATVAIRFPETGLSADRVLPPASATQIAPPPTAMPVGSAPRPSTPPTSTTRSRSSPRPAKATTRTCNESTAQDRSCADPPNPQRRNKSQHPSRSN